MSVRFSEGLIKSALIHSLVGVVLFGMAHSFSTPVQSLSELRRTEPLSIEVHNAISSASTEPDSGGQPRFSSLPDVNRDEISNSEPETELQPPQPKVRETRVPKLASVHRILHPTGRAVKAKVKNARVSQITTPPVSEPRVSGARDLPPIPVTARSGGIEGPSKTASEPRVGPEYLNGLIRLISAHRSYPRASVVLEEQGMVRIKMVLDQTGALMKAGLVTSSGFSRLDQAALETLRKIGRFPIPKRFQGELSVLVPIEYRLTP
jgi:protein TonB